MKINFAFFGGEPLSVPVLEKLKANNLLPSLIICNPDKPAGRNLALTPPPTKIWAEKNKIPYIQPITQEEVLEILSPRGSHSEGEGRSGEKLKEIPELFIVVAYGKIIPEEILEIPRLGTINLHPSLLPTYRGPSPIVSTILNGDTETGVTIIKLDSEMDHGPILMQKRIKLTGSELVEELEESIAGIGGEMLVEVINNIDNLNAVEQDHSKASFVKKIEKKDAEIKLTDDPIQNWRKYRAYHSSPRIFFFKDGKRFVITSAKFENGKFTIERIIPEGGKETNYAG